MKKSNKKKHETHLYIDSYKLLKIDSLPNGSRSFLIHVDDCQQVHGFRNDLGKFRPSLVTPYIIESVANELNFDGYWCFVDTNKIKTKIKDLPDLTHITGIYIFTIKNFTEADLVANVTTDFENSIIKCIPFKVSGEINPERVGWQFAVDELLQLGAKKAKIFVDSDLGDLKQLSKSLPSGYKFIYVSSDRQPTTFNTIFSRLDKLTHKAIHHGGAVFSKYRVIDYLWGNINHLTKEHYINK